MFSALTLKKVNGTPLLTLLVNAMAAEKLEAILIGNAAAAIHGAPVTTLDFDFMFRSTPLNLKKMKALARRLGGVIFRPYSPVSRFYRLVVEDTGLQAYFIPITHVGKSFDHLRSRANKVEIATGESAVADSGLRHVPTKSPCGIRTKKERRGALAALRNESERELIDMIRRRLALPIEKRMNFLRVRIPGGGSHL